MKLYSLVLFSVSCSIACQTELQIDNEIDTKDIVFVAKNGETDYTKTSRQEDGSIWWSPEDAIKVFCGESFGTFTSQNTESSATATFSGSFNASVSTDDISSKGIFGFYPASDDVTCSGQSITFTLPAHQTGVAGTFDRNLFPAIARSNDTELAFYNICGGARFVVSRDDIKTLTFKGNNNEPLAGKAEVFFDEDGIPQVKVIDGVTSIQVAAPGGGTFEAGKEYYIVLLPQVLEKGFSLTYNENGNLQNNIYTTEKRIAIGRSRFGLLSELDEKLPIKNPDEPIVFADAVMKEMCVNAFDTNTDGELSYGEAAAVTDLSKMNLTKKSFKTFDEFQYFTSVTSIPSYYFSMIGIKSIVLPKALKYIESRAFRGCISLVEITIPEGVTTIEDSAFEDCTSLVGITIPESVTTIGNDVFRGCSSLAEITIPESVTTIGNNVFYGCTSLTEINILEGVMAIGRNAFYGCTSLAKITIPESVMTIGRNAFYSCTSLAEITIPEGVATIGDDAFYGCTSLAEITILEGVTAIGNNVFYGCTSLTEITIPESVTTIGDDAFEDCTSLVGITIPESVMTIGRNAFYGCTSLAEITIPEGVKSIGSGAFEGCTSLVEITIPKSVTYIGFNAFSDYNSLIIYMIGTTPPTMTRSFCRIKYLNIYVPSEFVGIYKLADGWSEYAAYIVGYDFETN